MLTVSPGRWAAHWIRVWILPCLALTSLMLTGGCNADVGDDQMVLKISWRDGFFSQGFPTDLRKDDLQNNDQRIDVSGFPRPLQLFSLTYTHQIRHQAFGYSPAMPLYMQFGTGLQRAAHVDDLAPVDFASDTAPVQVIDIDPASPDYGTRYPLAIAMTAKPDQYRPQNLLQVRPVGKPLREQTTYALVVLREFAQQADSIQPNPELTALLQGHNPRTVNPLLLPGDARRAQQVYAPLAQFIEAHSNAPTMEAADIIGATVWTTGNASHYMKNIVEKAAQWTPAPLNSPWVLREETADYCVLESSWQVPVLQRGLIPFFSGGSIEFDAQNNPVIRRHRTAPVIVTIPKQPMPPSGYPLLHYHHGTGGLATQVFERGLTHADGSQIYLGSPAQVAAQRGWATAAMAGHLGADHQEQLRLLDTVLELIPGFTLNHTTYNFLNPKAMRDNFAQMLAERAQYRRLVMDLSLDAGLCPGAFAADGQFHFDRNLQAVMGQSLGSMTASASVATDPESYRGLIATGAGNYGLGLALYYSLGETDVGAVIEDIYLNVEPGTVAGDPFHPVWALAELILAPANVATLLSNDPVTPAPHVLVVEGHYDEQVTLPMQRPYLISLEADFINHELDVDPADQLLPDLQTAGYQQLFSPVTGNRAERTVGVVRYAEDGIMTGHHVAFQHPQPQHQYGCFLEDLALGLTPVLIAGVELGGACR
ncbi:MAG: hypothetical protein VYA55_22210 [Pseudomonadota bacterium]|nr:hypothetical protein [Pseudomonadota bacterium]